MALKDKVKAYDKKYSAGNFHSLDIGQNQVRILTEPELYDDVIEGSPAGSFIAYVIVRDPGNGDSLAILNLSKVVIRWLADEEDLGKFKTYPMPYDIMIFKQKSGDKTIYVSVAVDPANSPAITPAQLEAFNTAKPIVELAQDLAKKKAKKLLPAQSVALSPAEVVENNLNLKRNHSEVNPMFTAIQRSAETATDVAKLRQAWGMINICIENGSINDFEAELLKTQIEQKSKSFEGSTPVTAGIAGADSDQSIKVEDIPF